MLENKCVRFGFYLFCTMIISEIAYNILFKKKIKRFSGELNKVIFTNNLTQICCNDNHTINCNNKFCFQRNISEIVNLLNNAIYTIDLSMYIFTSVDLCEAILRAQKRGIKIRAICDETMTSSTGSQFLRLSEADVSTLFQSNGTGMLMHHKFCIIDGPKSIKTQSIVRQKHKENNSVIPNTGVLLNGSMNWTFQALSGNWDNIIITSNTSLISQFEDEFERMWCDFKDPKNG